jgi:hypothetical protein
MLYKEIIAVCSEIHTKHTNTLCGQNVELLNVKPVGTFNNHCFFKRTITHIGKAENKALLLKTIKLCANFSGRGNQTQGQSTLTFYSLAVLSRTTNFNIQKFYMVLTLC